jgi:hypothetical protein
LFASNNNNNNNNNITGKGCLSARFPRRFYTCLPRVLRAAVADVLFVVAAGNEQVDIGNGTAYPAGYAGRYAQGCVLYAVLQLSQLYGLDMQRTLLLPLLWFNVLRMCTAGCLAGCYMLQSITIDGRHNSRNHNCSCVLLLGRTAARTNLSTAQHKRRQPVPQAPV